MPPNRETADSEKSEAEVSGASLRKTKGCAKRESSCAESERLWNASKGLMSATAGLFTGVPIGVSAGLPGRRTGTWCVAT